MIVTTGNDVANRVIRKYLGVVRGIVVRSPSIAQGFLGGLKQLVGGNIEAYAQVCETARQEAFERMVEHAREIDADAIIGMRYDATEFSPGVTEGPRLWHRGPDGVTRPFQPDGAFQPDGGVRLESRPLPISRKSSSLPAYSRLD